MSDAKEQPEGRYAYEGLDRVLHEKARLGILKIGRPGNTGNCSVAQIQ